MATKPLSRLGFVVKWVYETLLVTLDSHRMPHCAGVGCWTEDGVRLWFRLYTSSHSFKNLNQHPKATINFTYNPKLWTNAILGMALSYTTNKFGLPYLTQAQSHISIRVEDIRKEDKVAIFTSSILDKTLPLTIALYNRAPALVIEALILYSRRNLLGKKVVKERIHQIYLTLGRIAPNSIYKTQVEKRVSVL